MRGALAILFIVVLSGCGTSREKWVSQHCSSTGSYEMGNSDAQHKRRTGLLALQQKCPSNRLKSAIANYEKGYKAGGGKIIKDKHEPGQDMLKDVVKFLDDESKPDPKKKPSKKGKNSQ